MLDVDLSSIKLSQGMLFITTSSITLDATSEAPYRNHCCVVISLENHLNIHFRNRTYFHENRPKKPPLRTNDVVPTMSTGEEVMKAIRGAGNRL